jgi:hypothetical protein
VLHEQREGRGSCCGEGLCVERVCGRHTHTHTHTLSLSLSLTKLLTETTNLNAKILPPPRVQHIKTLTAPVAALPFWISCFVRAGGREGRGGVSVGGRRERER